MKNKTQNKKNKSSNKAENQRAENKREKDNFIDGINLDYDYNTEYGDGDIPEIDK